MTQNVNTQEQKRVAISLANGDVVSGIMWGYPKDNNYLEIDSVQDNNYSREPICASIDGHEIESINIFEDRIFIKLWNRKDKNFAGNVELTIKSKHVTIEKVQEE